MTRHSVASHRSREPGTHYGPFAARNRLPTRPPSPTDVRHEARSAVARSPTLIVEHAPHRRSPLREVRDAPRQVPPTATPRGMQPTTVRALAALFHCTHQIHRRIATNQFAAPIHHLRALRRQAARRAAHPTAAILADRPVQLAHQRAARANDDGSMRRSDRSAHAAVDPRGRPLALPAPLPTPPPPRSTLRCTCSRPYRLRPATALRSALPTKGTPLPNRPRRPSCTPSSLP